MREPVSDKVASIIQGFQSVAKGSSMSDAIEAVLQISTGLLTQVPPETRSLFIEVLTRVSRRLGDNVFTDDEAFSQWIRKEKRSEFEEAARNIAMNEFNKAYDDLDRMVGQHES